MNRGDRSQTVPVPDSVVAERDVLNIEDTEPGKLSDPRQIVPMPDRVVVERDVRYVEDTEGSEMWGTKANSSSTRKKLQWRVMFLMLKKQSQ